MPDEALITAIENIMETVIKLGGTNERTSIVPNLIIQDANPTGLDGFVIVSDGRDGDNITARKLGSVIYANNDSVNVLFVEGAEAVAYQQGSQSTNNGIWEIVPSTTTDIFYDKGDVGIGNAAPTTPLDVTGTVTITDDILHAGDIDTKISFTDDDIEFTVGNLSMLKLTETAQDLVKIGDVDGGGDVDINWNDGQMFLRGSDGLLGLGPGAANAVAELDITSNTDASFDLVSDFDNNSAASQVLIRFFIDGQAGTGTHKGSVGYNETLDQAIFAYGSLGNGHIRINPSGDVGLSSTPNAQLHVDQGSTTAAQPVLLLDQADISEEMIQFETTIGVGNAIEAVGAKTLTVTHFIKVTLPGGLTRYLPVGTIA